MADVYVKVKRLDYVNLTKRCEAQEKEIATLKAELKKATAKVEKQKEVKKETKKEESK